MSMGSGAGTRSAVAEINVTPLIDVLLVLLIIFMVIVPVTPKGLGALIPQPPKSAFAAPPPDATIVVSVLATSGTEPSYKINDAVFPKAQVEGKLAEIFRTRQEKTMFIAADKGLEFSTVAEVIDMGHQASVDNIALMTSVH